MARTTIGLISDTHGLLRPEAVSALRGSDLIIHAGDVGDPGILAGPRRFKLPISVGLLQLEGDSVTPKLVTLEPSS